MGTLQWDVTLALEGFKLGLNAELRALNEAGKGSSRRLPESEVARSGGPQGTPKAREGIGREE